jgi:hypothetical protein
VPPLVFGFICLNAPLGVISGKEKGTFRSHRLSMRVCYQHAAKSVAFYFDSAFGDDSERRNSGKLGRRMPPETLRYDVQVMITPGYLAVAE